MTDRFVRPVSLWRQEPLGAHAQLRPPREKPRAKKRRELGGNSEHRRGWKGIQLAAALDEGQARLGGRHQSVGDAQFPAKRQALRLLNQERVWAAVENEVVETFADDYATRAAAGLEQHERHVGARELEGGGEARHAAAPDDDRPHGEAVEARRSAGILRLGRRHWRLSTHRISAPTADARSGRVPGRGIAGWTAGCRGRD